MCGRFTLANPDGNQLRLRFGLSESIKIDERPRFNIAPTDDVLAVRHGEDERDLGRLRWGLLPGMWAVKRKGRPLINARSETISSQPAFAESFRRRRCLIPADGFYEWKVGEDGKQPMWMSRPDGAPFAFAGVWAELSLAGADEGLAGPAGAAAADEPDSESVDHGLGPGPIFSCAIATCAPNRLMEPIHDRMPVILDPAKEAAWIDPTTEEDELLAMLVPAPEEALVAREVGEAVNSVRNDGPELLEPPMRLF